VKIISSSFAREATGSRSSPSSSRAFFKIRPFLLLPFALLTQLTCVIQLLYIALESQPMIFEAKMKEATPEAERKFLTPLFS
jgi:hypothetical protein